MNNGLTVVDTMDGVGVSKASPQAKTKRLALILSEVCRLFLAQNARNHEKAAQVIADELCKDGYGLDEISAAVNDLARTENFANLKAIVDAIKRHRANSRAAQEAEQRRREAVFEASPEGKAMMAKNRDAISQEIATWKQKSGFNTQKEAGNGKIHEKTNAGGH